MRTMSATGVVATYAAVVATGSLLWQVFIWRAKRRPDIRVSIRQYATTRSPRKEWKDKPPPTRQPDHTGWVWFHEVEVVVVNDGETTEVIESLVIGSPTRGYMIGSPMALEHRGDEHRIGEVRQPFSPGSALIRTFSAYDFPAPAHERSEIVAVVELVSGHTATSRTKRLDNELGDVDTAAVPPFHPLEVAGGGLPPT